MSIVRIEEKKKQGEIKEITYIERQATLMLLLDPIH